jgi:copper chaperone
MKKLIKIEGMSCNHCIMSVKKSLSRLELNDVKVVIGSAEVDFDESKVNEKKIIDAIENSGYQVKK